MPWLEGVLRDKDEWPASVQEDMRDNLKHYLDLLKWRLNKEKTMEMNKTILGALQRADDKKRLPPVEEITALRESAQALEGCYRRLMRAKTFRAMRERLEQRDGLKASIAYHDGWSEPTIEDDLHSNEHWLGFPVDDLVIVAAGEDTNRIFTGFVPPKDKGGDVEGFRKFVCEKDPSAFAGERMPSWSSWYSYNYLEIDGTGREDAARLGDEVLRMWRRMQGLAVKFREVTHGRA